MWLSFHIPLGHLPCYRDLVQAFPAIYSDCEDSLSSVSSRDLRTHFGFFLAQTSYPAIPAQAWPFPVVRIFCENVFYICMAVPLLGLSSHSSTFFYATPPLQLSEGREMARTPKFSSCL